MPCAASIISAALGCALSGNLVNSAIRGACPLLEGLPGPVVDLLVRAAGSDDPAVFVCLVGCRSQQQRKAGALRIGQGRRAIDHALNGGLSVGLAQISAGGLDLLGRGAVADQDGELAPR